MPAAPWRFAAYVLGQHFYAGRTVLTKKVTFDEAMHWLGDLRRNPGRRLCSRPPLSRHSTTFRKMPNSASAKAPSAGRHGDGVSTN